MTSPLTTAGLFALAVSTASAFVPHAAGGGAAVRARNAFSTFSPRAADAVAGSSTRGELKIGWHSCILQYKPTKEVIVLVVVLAHGVNYV